MSGLLLNEVFQWVAIASVLLLVLAAYRQLGLMVVDSRTYVTESFGPKPGQKLEARFDRLFHEPAAAWKLLMFVQDGCSICSAVLGDLGSWLPPSSSSVELAVVAGGDSAYLEELQRGIPGAVISAIDVLQEGEQVPGFPFTFLIKSDGTVVDKALGGDLTTLLATISIGTGVRTEEELSTT